MWRLNSDDELENMAGPWKYENMKLSIPLNSDFYSDDFIMNEQNGYVLGKKILDGKILNELIDKLKRYTTTYSHTCNGEIQKLDYTPVLYLSLQLLSLACSKMLSI